MVDPSFPITAKDPFSYRSIFSDYGFAALPRHDVVGDDGFGGHQIRGLDMADHLGGRLDAQLEGVDVHACKGRVGQAGEEGVVEGDDG